MKRRERRGRSFGFVEFAEHLVVGCGAGAIVVIIIRQRRSFDVFALHLDPFLGTAINVMVVIDAAVFVTFPSGVIRPRVKHRIVRPGVFGNLHLLINEIPDHGGHRFVATFRLRLQKIILVPIESIIFLLNQACSFYIW